MSSHRVLIVADVGARVPGFFHVGDEAMFRACCAVHAKRSARISAFTWSPERHAVLGVHALPWFAVPSRNGAEASAYLVEVAAAVSKVPNERGTAAVAPGLGRLVDIVAAQDLLHIAGGGNVNSHYPRELYARALLATMARSLGVPVLMTSQTLGPVAAEDEQALAALLHAVDRATVRDGESLALAHRLAPGLRVSHDLDDAFFDDARPDVSELVPRADADGAIRVGVSLHPWGGASGPQLAAKLGAALRDLASSHRIQVYCIPHVIVPGDQGFDVPLMELLRAEVGPSVPCRVFCDADLRLHPAREKDALVRQLTAAMDVVIASRYHAVVFGLATGVPSLGLAYDSYYLQKLEGAFAAMSLDTKRRVVSTTAGAGELSAAISATVAELPSLRAELGRELAGLALRRDHASALVEELLSATGDEVAT